MANEDTAQAPALEVVLELALELLGRPLVAGRRGWGHMHVAFQQLPALAVGGDGRVVVVVQDLLHADRHAFTLP